MEREVSQKLGRQDWLATALKVLAESGIEAVRVEPLAKLMNVTKGSFYWHFKNREDLLNAMLREWETRETDDIIKQVEEAGGDASAKLLYLFQLAYEDDGQLEKAMRTWAANDARAAAVIAQIDQRRLNYLQDLFLQIGFPAIEAKARARLAYYSWVGEFTVGIPTSQAERLAEAQLNHAILVRRD
jgi:AcrR family transcriptional regulator